MALNPGLFSSLKRAFRSVKIAKDGQPAQFTVEDGLTGGSFAKIKRGLGGEEYRVCCPFCSDTRHRLWINHRYGTTDELSGAEFGHGLVKCFNDGCDLNLQSADAAARKERQTELKVMLSPFLRRSLMADRVQIVVEPPKPRKAVLPETVVPLDTLPPYHPANHYLLDRGYSDPARLARTWGLMYCPSDPHPLVTNRIIIPVYYDGMLAGWQARYIGEPPTNNIAKYFTMPGMQKTAVLYNYNEAARFDFGLVVEGVTDVYSIGSQGMASLGASLSHHQIQLLKARWQHTGVAYVADGDVTDDERKKARYEQMMELLRTPGLFEWGVLEVRLPQGYDPGKMAASHLWQYIAEVAKRNGYAHDIFYPEAYSAACHDVQR